MVHTCCHCLGFRCLLLFNVFVRLSISIECCEKNCRLNSSRLSCGIGLSMRTLELICLLFCFDNIVFGGRFKVIGKWSKFCWKFVMVEEVHCMGLGLYI